MNLLGVLLLIPSTMAFAANQESVSLESWLKDNPHIASSIYWDQEGNGSFYQSWNQNDKSLLEEDFQKSLKWLRSEKQTRPEAIFDIPDPIPNIKKMADVEFAATVFSTDLAKREYFASVAFALALEYLQMFPWRLQRLNHDDLSILFDSREFFEYEKSEHGYVLNKDKFGEVSPASPERVYTFLSNNELIGSSPIDTLGRILFWSSRLFHFVISPEIFSRNLDGDAALIFDGYWQYRGFPPVMRVLMGTKQTLVSQSELFDILGVHDWTAGCWGTTGLLRQLLRLLNIPVSVRHVGGHITPVFQSEKVFLSHGDDPYYPETQLNLHTPVEMQRLLVPLEKWDLYYGTDAKRQNNVGFRPAEIAGKCQLVGDDLKCK